MTNNSLKIGSSKNNITIRRTSKGLDVSGTYQGYTLGVGPGGAYTGVNAKGIKARTKLGLPSLGGGLFSRVIPSKLRLPEGISEEEAKSRIAEAFKTFVGNEGAVARVSLSCEFALVEGTFKSDNSFLFTGPPGCGKTELIRRTGEALGVPAIRIDGKALTTRESLFAMVDKANALKFEGWEAGTPKHQCFPVIIAIDEVHLASRQAQESLLTATDASQLRVALNGKIVYTTHVTWIFATTEPSRVDDALKDRCSEVQLDCYEPQEIRQILINKNKIYDWPEGVMIELAQAGRCNPRTCLDLAEDTRKYTKLRSLSPEAALVIVLEERSIDKDYLGPLERKYLLTLFRIGRATGYNTLKDHFHSIDTRTMFEEVEPHLVRRGLVELSSNGRILTEVGRTLLENSPWSSKDELERSEEQSPVPEEEPGTSES